jgi:ParB family transcriptional regulator, chromosome partitioning protein
MTSSVAQWRLDTLSASARATAEIASLGAGLSLSAWLARLIAETCADEGVAPASEVEEQRAPLVLARIPGVATESEPAPVLPANEVAMPPGAVMIPVAAMAPTGLGTRTAEDEPSALCDDIAARGVRQPLLVRRAGGAPERYEIICGHRRWRAARRAGVARIPAIVEKLDDMRAVLASLAENLRAGDLSPIDEAHAYLRLLTHCTADVATISEATGRERQRIIRTVRLLGLPPQLRELIAGGALSAEHADLLLDANDPQALAEAILGEHLNPQSARERIAADADAERDL